jgi:hypothetical protein
VRIIGLQCSNWIIVYGMENVKTTLLHNQGQNSRAISENVKNTLLHIQVQNSRAISENVKTTLLHHQGQKCRASVKQLHLPNRINDSAWLV